MAGTDEADARPAPHNQDIANVVISASDRTFVGSSTTNIKDSYNFNPPVFAPGPNAQFSFTNNYGISPNTHHQPGRASPSDDAPDTSSKRSRLPSQKLPFKPNKKFVGRDDILSDLEKHFFEDSDNDTIGIAGLGGVGKTQIALQFAYHVLDKHEDYSIFWMPAVSMDTFRKACSEALDQCGRSRPSADEDVRVKFREWLENEATGKWLLILDNADDEALVAPGQRTDGTSISSFLPQTGDDRIILVTSRTSRVLVSLNCDQILDVKEMTPSQAMQLFRKSLLKKPSEEDDTLLSDLMEELSHLPLAISQAAAYVNAIKLPLKEYIQLLKSTENDKTFLLKKSFGDRSRYDSSDNAVLTTWIISFEQIELADPEAAELLLTMALLQPKAIPKRMLRQLEPASRMRDALGGLETYAFITVDEHEINMHRLVHMAANDWSRSSSREQTLRDDLYGCLCLSLPSPTEHNERTFWQACVPHLTHLLERTRDSDGGDYYYLCVTLGSRLRQDGRMAQSRDWISRAVLWCRQERPDHDALRLWAELRLTLSLEALGQTEDALQLLKHVVAVRERVLPEDDPHRLVSQHVLARVYLAVGQNDKALQLQEHVVAVQKRSLPEDHPRRLASQHDLARVHVAFGQNDKALQLLEHVVAVRGRLLSEDHPRRLVSQHELARVHVAVGHNDKALQLLEHVIDVQKRSLPEDHPDWLAAQHALAGVYLAVGQNDKALQLQEHVVAVQKISLPEDHPHRLEAQHELARAYFQAGQIARAIQLQEYVVSVKDRVLPEYHPNRLSSQHNLAYFYHNEGQVERALALQTRVVAISTRTLAPDHPRLLSSQKLLSGIKATLAAQRGEDYTSEEEPDVHSTSPSHAVELKSDSENEPIVVHTASRPQDTQVGESGLAVAEGKGIPVRTKTEKKWWQRWKGRGRQVG